MVSRRSASESNENDDGFKLRQLEVRLCDVGKVATRQGGGGTIKLANIWISVSPVQKL